MNQLNWDELRAILADSRRVTDHDGKVYVTGLFREVDARTVRVAPVTVAVIGLLVHQLTETERRELDGYLKACGNSRPLEPPAPVTGDTN